MKTILKTILSGLLLLTAIQSFAQDISPAIAKKIDSLFKQYDSRTSPGYAIGIVKGDSLIYAKGYGMANLEYNVPITPETIFHMASVSKQFTAFSIVLLARQGKLNLDDNIRKYLPWFPDLKQRITIRNLLNHTSGIRDQWQLLAIAGTRMDDVITQDQIIKILSKQQALNFKPGDQWLYSNSGFTLLAEIVKAVTGKTLRQFTDSVIFKPLGMNNTHFHNDYTEIVPNRAYSYDEDENGHYRNDILSYSTVGATSLFTNVRDMSKWLMNFYDHKVGDEQDIQQLTQKAVLNNGKVQDYAMGIVVNDYHGYKLYSHNGADAGYRTFIGVFPELKMGFIAFSNQGDSEPQTKALQMADLFIKDVSSKKQVMKPAHRDTASAILSDLHAVSKFTGDYIAEDGTYFDFELKDKKLYCLDGYSDSSLLVKAAKDTFEILSQPDTKFVFSADSKKGIPANEYLKGNQRLLIKYDATPKPDNVLRTYTGKYYSPELDCSYSIILKGHHLVLTNAKYDDMPLKLYGNDHLRDGFWWMENLTVVRNRKHQITGFEINCRAVRHVWFKKVE